MLNDYIIEIMIKRFLLLVIAFVSFPSFILSQVKTDYFLEGASVSAIVSEGDNIWVSTKGHGVFKYSKTKNEWQNFSSKTGNLENDLFENIAVSKDYVWAGATEGLFTYDKKRDTWRKRKFAQGGEYGNWIRSLYYDAKDNILWIGRFRNITRYEVAKNKFTDFDRTQNNNAYTNNIISIKADGDSVIWFGSEAGVHKYYKNKKAEDTDAWEFYTNKRNYFNNDGDAVAVSDFLFEGRNIWFGTEELVTVQKPQFNIGGIYRYNRQLQWKRFSKKDGLPGNGVYCFERTGNKIWAGLYQCERRDKDIYGKGLVLIDRTTGHITNVDLNQFDIKTATVQAMYFDGYDMWLGTDEGLYRMKIENPFAHWSLKKEAPQKQPGAKNQPKKK
jgi:ligand-binding sensor domain-containing protein